MRPNNPCGERLFQDPSERLLLRMTAGVCRHNRSPHDVKALPLFKPIVICPSTHRVILSVVEGSCQKLQCQDPLPSRTPCLSSLLIPLGSAPIPASLFQDPSEQLLLRMTAGAQLRTPYRLIKQLNPPCHPERSRRILLKAKQSSPAPSLYGEYRLGRLTLTA